MNKYFLLFIFFIGYKLIYSQNLNGNPSPATWTDYQSEYKWIDTQRLQFSFYSYRNNAQVISSDMFPDTAFVSIFYNKVKVVSGIITLLDSVFVLKEQKAWGTEICSTKSSCSNISQFTIFKYTGLIDFKDLKIKDTLNKLNACYVDIVFLGEYRVGVGNSFPTSNGSNVNKNYCYFSINRCFEWKKGDISSIPRNFHPTDFVRIDGTIGTKQIDFGCFKNSIDSIVYEMSTPKLFPNGDSLPYINGYSNSYPINCYCRNNNSPCSPRPDLNPPQGFFLNPITGICIFHRSNINVFFQLFCVKIKSYKYDINNKLVLVSTQNRQISSHIRPNISIVEYFDSNKTIFVTNLPYRRYQCINKQTDTLTFRLRDTMAVNQTIPDTIDYQVYHNIPHANYWESQTGTNDIELKLAWKPNQLQHWQNPYIFNINLAEKRYFDARQLEFRSCEFYVVQMPEFAIQKTLQNCGRLELKAVKTKPDENAYNYDWTLTHTSGTKLTTSFSDAVLNLPKSGKWYISLKTTNTPHGCSGTFLDSIELPFATPKISVTPQSKVCQGQTITYSAQISEVETPLQYLWQVGNQTSTDSFFSIQTIDSFKVKLSITDNRGCIATDSFEQKTFPLYTIQKLKDTAVCIGQSISVSAKPIAFQDSVLWLHNNSNNLAETLQLPQVYKVLYKNQNGCTAIDSFTLKNNNPIIPVKYNDQTVCKGDTVNLVFFVSGNVQYQNVQWRENGILQTNPNQYKKSIHQNSIIEISATGSQYNITCTERDTIQIKLHPTNTNRLQILKTDTCLKSNQIQANIVGNTNTQSQTIAWGDGVEEAYNNQTHQYSQAQSYQIILNSTTEHGCKDTQSQQIEIYPNPILFAQLKEASLCQNQSAELLISSIPNSTQHRINWGDGNSDNNEMSGTKFHTYTQSNNYNIEISATDNICKSDTSLSITISPLPQTTLTAENLCLGDSTMIKVQSNGNHQYTWSPQGTAVNKNTQSYKFPQAGNYEIKLQTTDLNQCQSRDSIRFSILERPKANFTYANLSRELKYKFKFINQSTNATGYEWFFTKTNTQTSTENSPEMVFSDTGLYTIILIADKDKQCFDTAQQKVPILEQIVFYLPNVVTLNNDGINETFGLSKEQKAFAKEYQLEIFNRWGERLFKTNDTNKDWHPTNIPLGVYIYQAKIRDLYNVLHEVKGVVEVVK
jgi:gliding motility-associated-like protein